MASGEDKSGISKFLNPPKPPDEGKSNLQQFNNSGKNGKPNPNPPPPQEKGVPPQDQGTILLVRKA